MSKKARVFVPLTKVDEAQRLVYGTITQEILDKSGEVMDYETSKPHFQKWSSDIEAASGGLSKGNLRVMHGLNVAGKLTDISFDDDNKSIEVCAKVVDDAEWEKVVEGCYTGFSVGGKYEKRWTDQGVKKYTAGPNEVSLVDNPCVDTATFALVKADGVEEQKLFKTVASEATEDKPTEEQPTEEAVQQELPFTNEDVVAAATAIAKAANDGTTWMDHVVTARDELTKAAANDQQQAPKEEPAAEVTEDKTTVTEEPTASVTKTTPAGVKQVWTASDGTTFEKKADAEAHEATLHKAAPSEADQLAERLKKALEQPAPKPEAGLWEDYDRLSKAVNALSTPFDENGQPKLEKGMYTINRFSSVLSDMASLSKSIKAESVREGGDSSDATISEDIINAVKSLGKSFLTYATDQVQELLAGMDDEVVVTYYDYYYNAAHTDGEDALAKDVCSIISDHREPSRERRESLAKAFGYVGDETESTDDGMNPDLQKRFDDLTADRDQLRKVAEDAVVQVEQLAKRVTDIENTPMPRAPNPRNVAYKEGDGLFFGKAANSPEEKMAILHDMIKTRGPDAIALDLIKAAQAGGGQQLSLAR